MKQLPIQIPADRIAEFCHKWDIMELSLFGSVLREDFGPDSDVDVLVRFGEGSRHGLLDLVRMELELGQMLGRKVDLVERDSVEKSPNYIRRNHVLKSLEPIYVEG